MSQNHLLQLLACLLCSPLVFVAMYLDYYYQYAFFYFIVILFPLLLVRKHRYLGLLVLLNSVVSSFLVHWYLPAETAPFFMPFDQYKEVLVTLAALFFGAIQASLLLGINRLKRWFGSGSSPSKKQ
ncbi:hypothetical protein ACTHPF_13565 [Paenibacillus sp. SAF-054]|uniref:hypothetical protein n=1 Tax=unclassified Paenibacillus TaxID=185978 RepID=UPI003F816BE0